MSTDQLISGLVAIAAALPAIIAAFHAHASKTACHELHRKVSEIDAAKNAMTVSEAVSGQPRHKGRFVKRDQPK